MDYYLKVAQRELSEREAGFQYLEEHSALVQRKCVVLVERKPTH